MKSILRYIPPIAIIAISNSLFSMPVLPIGTNNISKGLSTQFGLRYTKVSLPYRLTQCDTIKSLDGAVHLPVYFGIQFGIRDRIEISVMPAIFMAFNLIDIEAKIKIFDIGQNNLFRNASLGTLFQACKTYNISIDNDYLSANAGVMLGTRGEIADLLFNITEISGFGYSRYSDYSYGCGDEIAIYGNSYNVNIGICIFMQTGYESQSGILFGFTYVKPVSKQSWFKVYDLDVNDNISADIGQLSIDRFIWQITFVVDRLSEKKE
jgi:hypothetical protein